MVNYKIKNKKLFHDLQTDKLVCIVNIKLLYVFLYVYYNRKNETCIF